MKLLTPEDRQQLVTNGYWNACRILHGQDVEDFRPVVKLFSPWSDATWLLTEIDPNNPDIAFGLCDLGHSYPELGRISLFELASVRGPSRLRIERDYRFRATKTLSAYADEARRRGRIIE